MTDIRTGDQPMDRLTELASQMTPILHRPENEDIKAIVFLKAGDRGGIQVHGYDDQNDAVVDLFGYLRTIVRSMGRDLEFVAIPDSPEDLT